MKLVIVESPGKIKTIQAFLGSQYKVMATIGHCFQIEPTNDAIDIENNYEPKYIVIPKKKTVVNEIKEMAKKADCCYIASDNDREGEAIGWHVAKRIIKNICPIKRASFLEITKSAVVSAIDHPRQLDEAMFNSQQARSVLDMLVGFKVSPILWKKVCRGTSAGRVQSIGLWLIVERQKEIDVFKPEEYWDITGMFSTKTDDLKATYKSNEKLTNEKQVNDLIEAIKQQKKWSVASLNRTRKNRSPQALFNTASLQQFCSSTFGWDGKKTMSLAQSLYEGFTIGDHEQTGLITYHRTDSTNISTEAISAVRDLILKEAGKKYLPDQPLQYKSKNKNAQEAHEGIRPSHLEFSLHDVEKSIPHDEFKLYEAIYYRFVSCQMVDAQFDVTKVTIQSNEHTFTASGQIIAFDGFLKFWPYATTKDELLPAVNENDVMILKTVNGQQHFTKPPAAYNTASLVKMLEEKGIGRPSTYATIVDTLIKRQYVEKQGKAFVPTELGRRVSDYLVGSFPELMDTNFTARIEDQLDDIADNKKVWYDVVDGFYVELSKRLTAAKQGESLKGKDITDITCPTCRNHKLVKRFSKWGSFYGCEGYSVKGDGHCDATFKIGENGEPIAKEKKEIKYLEGIVCDKCGSKIAIRRGNKSGKEFGGCSKFPRCRRMFSLDGKPIEMRSKYSKFKKKSKETTED
ncbi:MAG: type I DNA topoisomerase [Nitrosarchaeum sp.]|nr:type I DNA topoisomerase [Nitrosarchaeum sp.]